ncbi:ABC transporter permease [Rhizobium ruizarguesonis]|uniref:ABC transporter permease n=1 Tax=Rhizobium ruizarguesonis TaxID=2081791 RepID=UPI001031942A|nr:ABC transporter permease [Rhizobium ruizarguesonis]TAT96077.1 ABC transporter permease [Rhizobium ruizarguesonis]
MKISLLSRVAVRLSANILTLLMVSIVTFVLMNIKKPEDIARSVLGREVTQDQIDTFIDLHQLNRPTYVRYTEWMTDFMRGDLGHSIITGRPVSNDIFTRLGRSLTTAATAVVFAIFGGILVGVYLAQRKDTKTDFRWITALLVLASMPEFLIGIALYLIFVVWLQWFPTQSAMAFSFGSTWDQAITYVLPSATISLLLMPHIARVARVATSEALAAGYVHSARLRGLSERVVRWDHAFRNAAVPLVSVIGLNMVYAVSGVLVVDYLFGFPGIGSLLVSAIGSGDIFVTQGVIMAFAVIIVLINIAVDVAILWLNPRLRLASI